MSAKVAETAEAVCGALYRLDFQFLGETDGGASTWFARGHERGKQVRVEVQRSRLAPVVLVKIEWPNVTTGQGVLVGQQVVQIHVNGPKQKVDEATERAVLRCLEVFRDVITEQGVAGPTMQGPAGPALNTESSTFDSVADDE